MKKSGHVIYLVLMCVMFLVLQQPAAAIRCFRCDHNEVSSGNNFLLSFVLKQMSKVDNPECKMQSRRDRHDIDIVECPPPSDWGSTYVCGTIRGTVAGTWKGNLSTTTAPPESTAGSSLALTPPSGRKRRQLRVPRASRRRNRKKNRRMEEAEEERRKEEEEERRRKEEEEEKKKEEEERKKEEEDENEGEEEEDEDGDRRKNKNEENENGERDESDKEEEEDDDEEEDEEEEEEEEEEEGEEEDLQVQFDTLKRDCVQVPAGESSYADRCVQTSVMDGPTQFMLQEAIDALGNFDIQGDLSFNGKTCYDTHGVPMEGSQLMCPTCTFNELLSVNSLLGPLVEAFGKNNEEACREQSRGGRLEVGYRSCKPSYQGEINKCILVEGEVTTKLLRGVGGGIDVRYFTVSRGCAQVDMMGRDRDQYRDGCHSKLPFSRPIRKLLVQGYKGASSELGDMTFKGRVCFNNETFSAEKPTKPTRPTKPTTPKKPAPQHKVVGVASAGQPLWLTPLLFMMTVIISSTRPF